MTCLVISCCRKSRSASTIYTWTSINVDGNSKWSFYLSGWIRSPARMLFWICSPFFPSKCCTTDFPVRSLPTWMPGSDSNLGRLPSSITGRSFPFLLITEGYHNDSRSLLRVHHDMGDVVLLRQHEQHAKGLWGTGGGRSVGTVSLRLGRWLNGIAYLWYVDSVLAGIRCRSTCPRSDHWGIWAISGDGGLSGILHNIASYVVFVSDHRQVDPNHMLTP